MNKCNENFIKTHDIDFSKVDSTIYDIKSINEIVDKYEIQGKKINKEVSVEYIYGIYRKDENMPHRFPEILDYFFDANGDAYHSRSVGMLEYDEENIIEGLKKSFEIEPIVLIEVDIGKYFVLTNGMHRFIAMRSLYLSAKSKCKGESQINELIKKYTIPVEVVKVDYVKTYCKYLINLFQPASCMGDYYSNIERILNIDGSEIFCLTKYISWDKKTSIYLTREQMGCYLRSYTLLEIEYDENYNRTGRSVLKEFTGEKKVLTDEELILLTKNIIITSSRNINEILETLRIQSQKCESFNQFLQLNFSDVLNLERGKTR